ncbi:DNA polymerase III subunit beta [Camelliibacillus cellulosilyticus]|uniref:Beta sliding clamp n=1 Tax=Camelliibacillus cellulosilyticus TaxID=2174486 RepID=A0ABV9GRY1_9BACL
MLLKLSVSRTRLAETVNHVMKAVSSRTTIPILTGIKIVATSDGLTLTGSDSDVSIQAYIPVEENETEYVNIEKTGSVVLPARYFADIVKKLPEDTVDIEVDNRLITRLVSGNSEFSLNGLDAQEYPRLPIIRDDMTTPIRIDLLKHVIRQTVFAVSTSETRPIFTGVHWNIQNGKLSCVATDSLRLAERTIAFETESTDNVTDIVIPGRSLNELSKILDDNRENWVDLIVTENQVLFKTKYIRFYSRLLEGNYPDTKALIPNNVKTEIIVDTKRFLHAIDRASLLARDERNNVIKVKTLENNQLEIVSQSLEIGRVNEQVPAKLIEGEEMRISFNAKFMMDALSRVDAEEIKLIFTGAMKPLLIKPVGDEGLLMLILPIRTN